ncbi:MAG: HAD family hydrolase [Bacteroidia bacterium]|nr:HAD family hydrolase [Bacteroidia bacterium]
MKKNLKKDFTGLKKIKVALLGDSATQFLNQALRACAYEQGFEFEIYEADYNQVSRQLLDLSSDLYQFAPEFVIVFESTQKLQHKFNSLQKSERLQLSELKTEEVKNYYHTLNRQLKAKLIYFNFSEPMDGQFGNYSNKTSFSFLYQVRKLNLELMNLSQECKNLFILDYQALSAHLGRQMAFDAKMFYGASMNLSIDGLPLVAKNCCDIISAINGKFKKCLILDLDNTMWGGIIGDDGIENIEVGDLGNGKAFSDLQQWARQLKQRGIILAVCSKNDEQTAKEPFLKHPEMVLRLDDIAVFVANWNNKADNIRYIQSILNIGFDAMVFLDDNPFERNLVRTNLPEVEVPELPEDPSMYLEYLSALNLFETASYSEEDELRNKHYQQEAGRVIAQKNFTNEDDFLKSLGMTSKVEPVNKFNLPRVAQLSQRSNQFNLRTVRYTEEDVLQISQSENYFTLTFDLKDKFGDNGLICVVVLKKEVSALFIETWLMSCRVLKRGMENFTLNTIVEVAKKNNFKKIQGEYLATSKNGMVKEHYARLGFSEAGQLWELNIENYQTKKSFIQLN